MTAPKKHLDEARTSAVTVMKAIVAAEPALAAAAIVDDLYGRISVTLWCEERSVAERIRDAVKNKLAVGCGQYFTGTVSISASTSPARDSDLLLRAAWDEGTPVDDADRLRLNDRYRNYTSWAVGADPTREQCWKIEDGPPVVVFHGFKGGVGRTTLLASYALACARRGQRVVVVDVDLDAPGAGVLLGTDVEGRTARWGTLDFFLEFTEDLPLEEYFHFCARESVTRAGRVEVFPSGTVNDDYLAKLGRADLEVRSDVRNHAIGKLLERIRNERSPDIILLDGRAGLSPAAGLLLSGIAHLHVLVATSNVQSLGGLERVVRHLGFRQARLDLPQRECIIVQAHVPDSVDAAKVARAVFASRVESVFREGYYAKEPTDDDRTWSLRDLESEVAPHVPVPVSYRPLFAHFSAIDDIVDQLLADPDHLALHQRIDERLGISVQPRGAVEGKDADA
jgi:cellulose biosynthesis protein BcsQ